jgi:stage IV sporulation protein FB
VLLNVYRTPFDLKWRMFGIPIRVNPSFWLVSATFVAHYLWESKVLEFFIGIVCIFVSLLIHELGHASMLRFFQTEPSILFFGLGGMTVPNRRLPHRPSRVIVALAGPIASFLVFAGVRLSLSVGPWAIERYSAFVAGFLITINVGWGVLNLLPVWPLDGGKISQEFWTSQSPGNGVIRALQTSMVFAALVTTFAVLCKLKMFPVDESLVSYRPGFFVAGFFAVLFVQNWLDLREQGQESK